MKFIVPVIRRTEVGYQLATTFIYGQDPVESDKFVHQFSVGLHTAFDKDLQIATRALHAARLGTALGIDFLVLPPLVAMSFVWHVVFQVWELAVEVVQDIPPFTHERAAIWAAHFKKVLNP